MSHVGFHQENGFAGQLSQAEGAAMQYSTPSTLLNHNLDLSGSDRSSASSSASSGSKYKGKGRARGRGRGLLDPSSSQTAHHDDMPKVGLAANFNSKCPLTGITATVN